MPTPPRFAAHLAAHTPAAQLSPRTCWALGLRAAALLALLLPWAGAAQAQALPPAPSAAEKPAASVLFSGAVFGADGLPLPGASVTAQGSGPRVPAITNAEGFFVLSLPAGRPARLLVEYPGLVAQQILLRTPEAEKNLVVTLELTARPAAPASREARPRRVRAGRPG